MIRKFCLSVLLLAGIAFGQELGTAVLNGDVADPSGAVVSGHGGYAQNKSSGVYAHYADEQRGPICPE